MEWRSRLMLEIPKRLLVVAALTLILSVCGGGGGGGGTSPTAPPAPPPPTGPPPDTSQTSNDSLVGNVVGLFEPGANFAGATIQITGLGNDTIRTDNSFRIEPVPPGEHVLTIRGGGFLKRQVMFEMKEGGANEIRNFDLAESAAFNLEAFDEIYRMDGETPTARMRKRPIFRVAKNTFDALPSGRGDFLLTSIDAELRGNLRRAVSPFMDGVKILHEDPLKRYKGACNPDLYEIHIFAERDLKNDDGDRLYGQAQWCWWPEQNEVSGGMILLDDEAVAGTVAHEAIHIIGSAGHLERSPGVSIMAVRGASDLTSIDDLHLKFLFARPPGVETPDDARRLQAGDYTRLEGGSGGLEVTCELFKDGRARITYGDGSRAFR